MEQSLMDKLTILADSAKYDVACTSSGASRAARAGSIGSARARWAAATPRAAATPLRRMAAA